MGRSWRCVQSATLARGARTTYAGPPPRTHEGYISPSRANPDADVLPRRTWPAIDRDAESRPAKRQRAILVVGAIGAGHHGLGHARRRVLHRRHADAAPAIQCGVLIAGLGPRRACPTDAASAHLPRRAAAAAAHLAHAIAKCRRRGNTLLIPRAARLSGARAEAALALCAAALDDPEVPWQNTDPTGHDTHLPRSHPSPALQHRLPHLDFGDLRLIFFFVFLASVPSPVAPNAVSPTPARRPNVARRDMSRSTSRVIRSNASRSTTPLPANGAGSSIAGERVAPARHNVAAAWLRRLGKIPQFWVRDRRSASNRDAQPDEPSRRRRAPIASAIARSRLDQHPRHDP